MITGKNNYQIVPLASQPAGGSPRHWPSKTRFIFPAAARLAEVGGIPGSVPNTQVPALLEQHDIFLLASDSEGLPISLLEAMTHGVVPVVTDLESGIRDVVDATNGMLVPVDEVAGYARAILHLHAHREELAAKSAAAHERVKTVFSVAAMTDRWLAAFPPPPAELPSWPRQINFIFPSRCDFSGGSPGNFPKVRKAFLV